MEKTINSNSSFFILIALIIFINCSTINPVKEEYFEYERIEGNRVRITGYSGPNGNVRIPQLIQNMLVTEIGDEAFLNAGITKVDFPGNLRIIGKDAFRGNNLTSIKIPATLVSIKEGAFRENRLDNVSLTGNLNKIEKDVFKSNNLIQITIPANIKEIDAEAFAQNNINRIRIASNVEMASNAFDNSFAAVYLHLGKKAGTYVLSNRAWKLI